MKSHESHNSILGEWDPYIPFYIAALVLTIIVISIDQFTHPLHPDVAFHVSAARLILEKGSLHEYYFDANPPIFAYMLTIPVLLNSFLGISVVFWVKSFVFMIAGLSCISIKKELAKWSSITLSQSIALACLFLPPMLFGHDFEFGQRDHYCAILFIPYVVYVAVTWADTSSEKRKISLTPYLCLAVGLAIKPYFIIIWIVGEGLLAFKADQFRSIINSGNFLIIIFGILYLTFIAIFDPYYYSDVLPVAISAFGEMGSEHSLTTYLLSYAICALAFGVNFFVKIDREIKAFVFVFCVSAVAAMCAYFIQSGYSYQTIPADTLLLYSFGLIFFFMGIQTCNCLQKKERKFFILYCKGLLVISLMALIMPDINALRKINDDDLTKAWEYKYQSFIPQTKLLRVFKPSTTVGSLSVNMFLHFPAVLYSNVKWEFVFPHLWPLPKMVMDKEFENKRFDWFAQKIASNLAQQMPNIMLVDQHYPTTYILNQDGKSVTFDYIKYLNRSEVFKEIWKEYSEIGVISLFQNRCIKIFAHKNFVLSHEVLLKLKKTITNPKFQCPIYDYP